MNNSLLALESVLSEEETHAEDRIEALRSKEEELTKVIKALEVVGRSDEWSSLKTLVFGPLKENLEKSIFQEATKQQPDLSVLNSLRGQWMWAKRYADLDGFRDEKRAELTSVRKTLQHGKIE